MHGGPHHPHVTVAPPGNASVTMPRGRIKGASSPVRLPELAHGQLEGMREEVLEEPVEFLSGG